MKEKSWAPTRIWVQKGFGENGANTCCEDSINYDGVEEVGYIRIDWFNKLLNKVLPNEFKNEKYGCYDTELEKSLKFLNELEPFLDSIVCYASTCCEYRPNGLVVEIREFLDGKK